MKKLTAILSISVFILISISSLVFAAETNMTQTTPAQKIQESQRAKRYEVAPEPVHQYIALLAFKKLCYTNNSLNNTEICNEISQHIPDDVTYPSYYQNNFTPPSKWTDAEDTIDLNNYSYTALIEGAWEEDNGSLSNPINHFWNPDGGYGDGIGVIVDSAIEVANENRFSNAISNYQKDNTHHLAYYWLGRTAHLLMDMSVPAHVLLDPHLGIPGCEECYNDPDNYETYTASHYSDIKFINSNISDTTNNNSTIPDISKEIRVYTGYDTKYPELSNLFFSLAKQANRYSSNDKDCHLQNGKPCLEKCDVNCSGKCDLNSPKSCKDMQDALQTRAVAYTVELYKLFWRLTHPVLNAEFTSDNNIGTAPLTINFTDLSTGNIKAWYWDFGDGTTSSDQNPPPHTYQNPGTYTVSLRVSDPNGTQLPTVKRDYVYVSGGATGLPGYASVSQLTISPSSVTINSNFNISFTLKEVRGASKTFEKLIIAILDANGNDLFDFKEFPNETISAYGTLSRSFTSYLYPTRPPGTYKAVIRGVYNGELFDFDATGGGVNPKSFYASASASVSKPDIVVQNVSLNKTTFYPGESLNVSTTIKNISGVNISNDIRIKYYLSNGYKIDASPVSFDSDNIRYYNLTAGVSKDEATSTNVPSAVGVYNISVCADTDNVIDESDENNNCSPPIVFNVVTPPDLVVQNVSLSKTTLYPGESFRVTATTKNVSSGDIDNDIRIKYYLSTGSTINATASFDNDNIRYYHLTAGSSWNEYTDTTAPTVAGTYNISVQADVDNSVNESNENNNWSSPVIFTVVQPPALAAFFTRDVSVGNAPLTVKFTDTSTGQITGWTWNFGDGYTSYEQNPSHTYASEGTYTVTLKITGSDGSSNTKTWAGCVTVSKSGGTTDGGLQNVIAILKILAGIPNIPVTADMDANHDGKIGIDDAVYWLQIVAGTRTGGTTSCTYSISPANNSLTASSGSALVSVSAQSGCNWTATSNTSWITITSGSSGSGNGTVAYSVAANSDTSSRTGTMTIAGQTFTVTQAGISCVYSISPANNSSPASSGSALVSVTAQSGCNWTAVSNATWITITSGSSGSGNGTVSYSVASNSDTSSRTGTMTIAGQTFTVTQAGGTSIFLWDSENWDISNWN